MVYFFPPGPRQLNIRPVPRRLLDKLLLYTPDFLPQLSALSNNSALVLENKYMHSEKISLELYLRGKNKELVRMTTILNVIVSSGKKYTIKILKPFWREKFFFNSFWKRNIYPILPLYQISFRHFRFQVRTLILFILEIFFSHIMWAVHFRVQRYNTNFSLCHQIGASMRSRSETPVRIVN
jgi:hypothetical protein